MIDDPVRAELARHIIGYDPSLQPLSVAAALDDPELVARLVELGAPVDRRNDNALGYTPLIHAAREGRLRGVRALLAHGANVNGGDSINGTALHQAAVGGGTGIAQVLLDAGARVDAVDDEGRTPLVRLSAQADAATVTARTGDGPEVAISHPNHDHHLATARLLLAAGADPNHVPANGYSCLHHAASHGAVDLIEVLIAAGGDPGLQNGAGYAPLHAACDESQAAAVVALLRHGADPNVADGLGFVPLHGAACQGSVEITQLLLAAGADPSRPARDSYDKVTPGMTPADAAAAYRHPEIVAILRA